jgi:hypothetical protein
MVCSKKIFPAFEPFLLPRVAERQAIDGLDESVGQ